ncbi:hypothetical protein [Novosphingobium album (ex Liu et al. 2023)]|nr:hypothetical protein [Novosphingobium album (ex Liu et al. 2023)]
MQRIAPIAALIPAALALIGSAPPPPVPGGPIGVLQQGHYLCEMPGDATGPIGHPVADIDFRIVNASGYNAGGKHGNYLLTGDILTMTTGTLKGLKFHRVSERFLRRIEDNGEDGPLRCVLTGRTLRP